MVELQGKKSKQPSSRPDDWAPSAIVVQLELTCRQELLCPALRRHRPTSCTTAWWPTARADRDAGLWLSRHELEKEFNAAKRW